MLILEMSKCPGNHYKMITHFCTCKKQSVFSGGKYALLKYSYGNYQSSEIAMGQT